MTCSRCGGDVLRFFVGDYLKYRHTAANVDHAPMPVQTSRSEIDAGPPPVSGDSSSRRSRLTRPEPTTGQIA